MPLSMVTSLLSWLEGVEPTMLWGLYVRIFGLVFAFALAMLYRQVVPLKGEKGLFPIQGRLARIRADYPNVVERILRFPTIHWLFSSDVALQRLILGSATAGFVLTVLGVHSRLGFAIMWVTYLSFFNKETPYPWDALLMESAFLSLFLPVLSVTSLAMPTMPLPLLAFSYRLLLFRLMFGFGKFKFIGASTKEFSYLRGFMINQPMPTIFGWLIHQLPLFVHVFSLAIFFVSEMIVPFFFFSSGTWRIAAALITAKLMAVIQLTGNFGFFNLLAAVLCIPMLDGTNAVFAHESLWSMVFSHGWPQFLVHLVLLFLLLLACVFFPFNSWCSDSFFIWPALSLPVNPLGKLLRFLAPYRLVFGYGVFFPHSSAGCRWVPIIEGTDDERINDLHAQRLKAGPSTATAAADATSSPSPVAVSHGVGDEDGIVWREYEYKFMTTRTDRMPAFCAPWHWRLDQAILYEAVGMSPETFMGTLTGGNRYEFNPVQGGSMLSRLCACLLQDNTHVETLFRTTPFTATGTGPNGKLQALRISFYLFAPTSVSELAATGQYWQKKYVGEHVPLITRRMVDESLTETRETGFAKNSHGDILVREPEMGHPDNYVTTGETPVVRALFAKLDAALATNSGASSIDSTALLMTEPNIAPVNLVQPILREHVDDEFWGGFIARLQPILGQLRLPASAGTKAVPQLDFEFHLPAGTWSRSITALLRSPESPLAGLTGAQIRRIEKTLGRATLLLLRRLLPIFHGPGTDEMMTGAEVTEATNRRGGGKKGIFGLHACKRDLCTETHLHLPSFFNLHLFAQHLLSHGRGVFEAALLDPLSTLPYVRTFSVASALLFQGVLHSSVLAYHAAKMRMISRISFKYQLQQGSILPGFLAIYNNFLVREYRSTPLADEGAFSATQYLPDVTYPQRYDQHWVVELECMTVRNASGLVETATAFAGKQDDRQQTKAGKRS